MKLKTKLILATLFTALLPLVIAMGISLNQSKKELSELNIRSAQSHIRAGAEKLSGYFAQRISEISIYANTELIKTMDWKNIGPFLRSELKRHKGTYEKLVIGTTASNYYSTSGGNPAHGGLTSFDNNDPKAKLKSMAKRHYWQYLVHGNAEADHRTYVSDPIISYTTGVRQVLVGATILSKTGHRVSGLVAGTIQWKEIETLTNRVRDEIRKNFGQSAKLLLISKNGIYIYHWDQSKIIHRELDNSGKPVFNDIGEKVSVYVKITDEPDKNLAMAGYEMIEGLEGVRFFMDPELKKEMAIFYAPVPSANYSMAVVIPKDNIMAPLTNLTQFFIVITLLSIGLSMAVSLLLARRLIKPVEFLDSAARSLAEGNLETRIDIRGKDEISDLARAFNEMACALQKREKALTESKEKYRLLIKNLPGIVFKGFKDWSAEFIDNKIEALTGFDMDDFNSHKIKWVDIILKDDFQNAKKSFIHGLKTDQSYVREYRITDKNRKTIWIQERGQIIFNNRKKIEYINGVFFDISDLKDAEKAIQESEEKYKKLYKESKKAQEVYGSLLNSSADAVIVYDMIGNTEYISPAFTQMFGWTLEEVKGKRMPFVPESEIEPSMNIIRDVVEKGIPSRNFETKRFTKDGNILDINISASRYNDHEGNPAGMLVILRDISERKKIENQLQQAKRMETVGTLAGGVAHDLNNILSGIVSYPELLLMDLPEDSSLRKPILTIKKSGEKAAAIVQDLLTLARRGVAVREVVNLNQIISDYLINPEYINMISFHPDISVETNLGPDLLNIEGSPVHLLKTVMNLASNAAEAMPHGGKITISTENRYIDRVIKGYDNVKEGDYIVLKVSDTGIGMATESLERIFEPFYTKKVMGKSGTGLGMAVVWGTVKDHNGYIDIESVEGKGSTFTIYFPVTRQEIHKKKKKLTMESYMGNGESILVIDDVEEQREIAAGMLRKLGYTVAMVASGEKAVEYMKHSSADIIILDMIMDPGIDGLETYKRILEFHPEQKAIIASGFSETKRVKKAQELGAGAYVKKPYILEKIGIAVKNELNKR